MQPTLNELQVKGVVNWRSTWEAGFSFPGGGGGSIEPSGWTPPSPKKGSIDRTPEILPSLTPRPWR